MLLHILFWYVVVCYTLHSIIFIADLSIMLVNRSRAIKAQAHTGIDLSRYIQIGNAVKFGIIALLLAPLTTWHAALHYAAIIWYKSQNKPVKYWV